MVQRTYRIEKLLKKQRVLIIYGPRRVGKTTLLKEFLKRTKLKYKWNTGDDIKVRQVLGSQDLDRILEFYQDVDLAAIDEAQYIPNIGMGLKLLVDNMPGITVVITGSSSFNIEQETGEPLTGRKKTIPLYPFALAELHSLMSKYELKEKLDELLIFGSYPDVFLAEKRQEKIEQVLEIVNSYLLKDVFALATVKGTKQFVDLLKLLAFQIGNEVSLLELGNNLEMDTKTVARYLDLLEKTFVIKRLTPYSGNLRREISSKNKFYFLDNGIRNGVISQFNALSDRNDAGQLFENFIFSERIKLIASKGLYRNLYFWRTYAGQEIDFIEEYDGKLYPYEIKFNEKAKPAGITEWKTRHKSEPLKLINRANYLEFLL